MFHLNPGVHLDEIELVILVQEFEGAGAAVTDPAAGFGATLADLVDQFAIDAGGGRLFDDFLVATLHRAVALAQIDRVAMLVGEYLDLDMARVLEILLHVDDRVAERSLRLGLGGRHGIQQCRLGMYHPHPAPATAARGLDDHRVSDRSRRAHDLLGVVGQRTVGAGHAGNARGLHGVLGAHLVAHQLDRFGTRADEHEARLLDPFGEFGVFRQETVAGMNRFGVGHFGR